MHESLPNSTSAATLLNLDLSPRYTARFIVCAFFVFCLLHRCVHYFTSEFPPLRSGFKRLPGPWTTLPYLGRIHDVDRMRAWIAIKKFSDQYDGLFAMTLGGETHIWVAREDIAQDLLVKHAAISSARADLGAYPNVTQEHMYLPFLGYIEAFHRQKRFAHSMRSRSKANNYYGYIDLETNHLMRELKNNPKDWWMAMHIHCTRISSRLAYGSPDLAEAHVTNAGKFLNQIGPSGPPQTWRRFLHISLSGSLWTGLFEKTKNNTTQDVYRKTYVGSSLEAKANGEHKGLLFENKEEAMRIHIAGPATLFVMVMILHPEWQFKVRTQIDEVVEDGVVTLDHSPQLPMLRAAIKECVRWKTTVPLGVPRLLAADYQFNGYHFPKGAVVHVLDIAMSQDPKRYVDPAVYNPGRWLGEASPNFRAPLTEHPRLKGHHIFGRGERACPGQDLAEAELFVMCGNLLNFSRLAQA
ncbi:hypothetical protein E8E11_000641 [Didymella keratinophila]|nr:hypothetical protein E8E11_000641 [Didymella keratinophila]